MSTQTTSPDDAIFSMVVPDNDAVSNGEVQSGTMEASSSMQQQQQHYVSICKLANIPSLWKNRLPTDGELDLDSSISIAQTDRQTDSSC